MYFLYVHFYLAICKSQQNVQNFFLEVQAANPNDLTSFDVILLDLDQSMRFITEFYNTYTFLTQ